MLKPVVIQMLYYIDNMSLTSNLKYSGILYGWTRKTFNLKKIQSKKLKNEW